VEEAVAPLLGLTTMLAGVCLLQHVLTGRGASDALGPNRLVGIKMRATLSSDAAWRAGHAAAQPALRTAWVGGLVGVAVLGSWWLAVRDEPPRLLVVACALLLTSVAASFAAAVRRAEAAARRVVGGG